MVGTNIARGGKSLYGAPLGILMLEARFPRIPGDMGNGTTWPFPVLFRVVRGASPEKVVLNGATACCRTSSPRRPTWSISAPRPSPPTAASCRSSSARSPPPSACRWRPRR